VWRAGHEVEVLLAVEGRKSVRKDLREEILVQGIAPRVLEKHGQERRVVPCGQQHFACSSLFTGPLGADGDVEVISFAADLGEMGRRIRGQVIEQADLSSSRFAVTRSVSPSPSMSPPSTARTPAPTWNVMPSKGGRARRSYGSKRCRGTLRR
jgi:hypothetical protein